MSSPNTPETGPGEPTVTTTWKDRAGTLLVPTGGFVALSLLSFTLIVVVILRPWAGPDKSWRTHLNLTHEHVEDYGRTIQSHVSPEGFAPIGVWERAECDGQSANIISLGNLSIDVSPCGDERVIEWVANGCGSCHGVDGTGGVVGPNALAADSEKIAENVRFGPTGMPAHDTEGMTDAQLALIQDYLRELRETNPQLVPTPVPTPLPTPAPTPTPVASAPSETSATPAPSAGAPDSEVIAIGKKIYDETAGDVGCAHCHGLNGKGQGTGGDNTPDIRGMGRSKVRGAIRDILDMNDIKLTSDELLAVVEYLKVLNQQ